MRESSKNTEVLNWLGHYCVCEAGAGGGGGGRSNNKTHIKTHKETPQILAKKKEVLLQVCPHPPDNKEHPGHNRVQGSTKNPKHVKETTYHRLVRDLGSHKGHTQGNNQHTKQGFHGHDKIDR